MMKDITPADAELVDESSFPFDRDEAGRLQVSATRLCQIIGLDPSSFEMRLLAWRTLAEFLDLGFGDDSRDFYLPSSMVPDFLKSLEADATRQGLSDEIEYYQTLFGYMNDLFGKLEQHALAACSAEKMNRLHRFLLKHCAGDLKESMPET